MNQRLRALPLAIFVLLALGSAASLAGQGLSGFEEKATLELVPDRTAYRPGEPVRIAARMRIEDHWHVNSHTPTYDYLIPTELSLELPAGATPPRFTYPPHEMQAFQFTDEPIAVYDGLVTIAAEFELPATLERAKVPIEAALRYQACDDRQCLPPVTTTATVELAIGDGGVANARFEGGDDVAAVTGGAGAAGGAAVPGLLGMLLLAVAGGLLLNAMPCVLPVLSLKVFSLMESAGRGRGPLVTGALATTAGIVASFWALALAAVLAARAGAAVGWGIQFQQPGFVAFLAVVVVLFSLNMWGLFEIPLPQGLARVAGAGPREGLLGHFVTGLFATLMATPCSAPFLGTAVGFALTQPAPLVFAIFTAVGLGLALPYLLLAAVPGAAGFLPRPGAWMVTFRNVLGFFLAAAAVWLFYVLANQIPPERIAAVQLALLLLALATWFFGRAARSVPRRLAAAGMAAAAVGTIFLAASSPAAAASTAASGRIDWVAFDETEARRLAGDGRLVFVDFTADWCLTCKANERLVIETDEVAAAFDRYGVVPMKADWTNRDDAITAVLKRFGRAAVPFYLLYRPGDEPRPLGELLTRRGLLDALEDAAGGAAVARTEP